MTLDRMGLTGFVLAAVLALSATPAWAQGKGKPDRGPDQPAVTLDLALSATRDVLVGQGYEVVSVETLADRQIITYRAGNQGRGRGKGPPMRMVIRRVENRIVLDETPEALRIEIGVRLGIKL